MKKLIRFIPAVMIMAMIFCFSAQSGDSSTQLSDSVIQAAYGSDNVGSHTLTVFIRKSAHFLEYTALGAAMLFGLAKCLKMKKAVIFSVLSGTLYAVTDEVHQYFVPGRACMASDVLLDSLGTAAGTFLFLLILTAVNKLCKKNSRKD